MSSADLSDVIVSVAEGVSEASRILNRDPNSTMSISSFTVDTTLWASLDLPKRKTRSRPSDFRLLPTDAGTYRLASPVPSFRSARLVNWIRPSLQDAALSPHADRTGGRVRIRATLEAVPHVTPADEPQRET